MGDFWGWIAKRDGGVRSPGRHAWCRGGLVCDYVVCCSFSECRILSVEG